MSSHGGYRPGSGRKPTGKAKTQMPIYVSGELAEYLKIKGATKVVEEAIPRTQAFRDWRRDEKNRKKLPDT